MPKPGSNILPGGGRRKIGTDADVVQRDSYQWRRDEKTSERARMRFSHPSEGVLDRDYTGKPLERALFDPSGTTFTIKAPPFPVRGDRWAVKNVTSSSRVITIDGNGYGIEDPNQAYSLPTSFSLCGDGASVEWEFANDAWQII